LLLHCNLLQSDAKTHILFNKNTKILMNDTDIRNATGDVGLKAQGSGLRAQGSGLRAQG
jgi:hypothetical protein